MSSDVSTTGAAAKPTAGATIYCASCRATISGESVFQCPRCNSVQFTYCNRSCFRQHWKIGGHKTECKRDSAPRATTSWTVQCAHCGRLGAKLKCSRCHRQSYCGPDCQRQHWKQHKVACNAEAADRNSHGHAKSSEGGAGAVDTVSPRVDSSFQSTIGEVIDIMHRTTTTGTTAHRPSTRSTDAQRPMGVSVRVVQDMLMRVVQTSYGQAGAAVSTRDFVEKVVLSLTRDHKCAYVHTLGDSADLVGPATAYVSHAWDDNAGNLFASLIAHGKEQQQTQYFWVDVLCYNQHAPHHDMTLLANELVTSLPSTVKACHNLLVIAAPHKKSILLHRAWCILELLVAALAKMSVFLRVPPKDEFDLIPALESNVESFIWFVSSATTSTAETTRASETKVVRSVIEQTANGSSAAADNIVRAVVRACIVARGRQLLHTLGNNPTLYALVSRQLAVVTCKTGDPTTAIQLFDTSIKVHTEIYKRDGIETGWCYLGLGEAYELGGDLNKAEELFKKALIIMLQAAGVSGNRRAEIATAYTHLGNVYTRKCDFEMALKFYKKSLELRLHDKNNRATALVHFSLGTVHLHLNDSNSALAEFKSALKIREKECGKYHEDVVDCHNSIANAYDCGGNLRKAIEHYQLSVNILGKCYGKVASMTADEKLTLTLFRHPAFLIPPSIQNHDCTTAPLMELGYLHARQTEFDKAFKCLDRALAIKTELFGDKHMEIVKVFCRFGETHAMKADFKKALPYFMKAMEICHAPPGPQYPLAADVYSNLAEIHAKLKNFDQALAFFAQELQLTIAAQGPQSPGVAVIYNNMGRMHSERKSHEMAIDFFTMALDITSVADPGRGRAHHPAVLPLCVTIASEYSALGNHTAAAKYHDRARRVQGK